MKYAGIVLRNVGNSVDSVDHRSVFDALLAGGVFLDEIVLLPYDAPSEVSAALVRLSLQCDGVFLVCDRVLLGAARDAVESVAEAKFSEEYLCETEKCLFAVLPAGERGAEIVNAETVARVDRRRRNSYCRIVLRAISPPADKLRAALSQAEEAGRGRLTLHTGDKFGCTRIEVIYDSETPKMTVDEVVRILASGLGDSVYALEDVSIAQRLCEALKLHRLHIAVAESFTAGGVGRAIVSVPGASAVFYEGLNTYDNRSKIDRLGVSEYTLMSKGAVSDEVAYEMAAGLISQGNCDVAIATTGIAGPASDQTNKPVGLCFLAIGTKERVRVFRYRLTGNRETITETAINLALFLAYREIA